jgi:hypothetical protein
MASTSCLASVTKVNGFVVSYLTAVLKNLTAKHRGFCKEPLDRLVLISEYMHVVRDRL